MEGEPGYPNLEVRGRCAIAVLDQTAIAAVSVGLEKLEKTLTLPSWATFQLKVELPDAFRQVRVGWSRCTSSVASRSALHTDRCPYYATAAHLGSGAVAVFRQYGLQFPCD